MPLKSWILDKLNRMDSLLGRPDLPQRAGAAVEHRPQAPAGQAAPAVQPVEHLGPYAPLIEAIRDELQQFVDGPLRLHLAIAERDQFMLTSIDIGCNDDSEALDLLRRFIAEFKPDQIRRFLRRDIISALPNSASIDLSQFAGLRAILPPGSEAADAGDDYAALLAELRAGAPAADPRAYVLTLGGRWVERDGETATDDSGEASRRSAGAPQTPLAGHRLELEVDDRRGRRKVALAAVVAGRRYSIGKGGGCDIPVDGTYTSRRHAEIWFDQGAWWLLDTGSTNGVRVDGGAKGVARSGPAAEGGGHRPIRLPAGARIVLSALTEGPTSDYPALTLHTADPAPRRPRRSPPAAGRPSTPITPVVAPRGPANRCASRRRWRRANTRRCSTRRRCPSASADRAARRLPSTWSMPASRGATSRSPAAIREGAEVVVHGDNGVLVGETLHPHRQPPALAHRRADGARPDAAERAALHPATEPDMSSPPPSMITQPMSIETPWDPSSRRAVDVERASTLVPITASGGSLEIDAAAASSCAPRHENNEDAHSPLTSNSALFVVADGVGGGAMASTASRELVAHLHIALHGLPVDAASLRAALQAADRRIAALIAAQSPRAGAATVAVCCRTGASLGGVADGVGRRLPHLPRPRRRVAGRAAEHR